MSGFAFANMKQLFRLTLVILSLCGGLFGGTYGDLTYSINGDEITITDCEINAIGELIIPSMIEGNPVTSIWNYAFEDCSNLTDVTIPNSVTIIGNNAFKSCSGLIAVTIGNGVVSIGGGAFEDCSSLSSLTIPNSVTTIDRSAFSSCTRLKSVIIPAGVTAIAPRTFYNCTSLESMTFNGNAPGSMGTLALHYIPSSCIVYFYEGTTGFTPPTWRGFSCVELSLNADDDGDNLPNELERKLGTNPLDENSRFEAWLSLDETGLLIHFGPYSEDCHFVVQSTNDISDPNSWGALEGLSFSGNAKEHVAELSFVNVNAVFYRVSVREKSEGN